MAMTTYTNRIRSQRVRGRPIFPLKLKASSLPISTNTQPKSLDTMPHAHRSLTCPMLPSSDASLETRISHLYGASRDHLHSPISPLDIDEPAAHGFATYTLQTSTEDLHLSDPEADDSEADDSSDSGSELSFYSANSSGRSSPVGDADEDIFALDEDDDGHSPEQVLSTLPQLLLLHTDDGRTSESTFTTSPETLSLYPSSLSDTFLRSVPDDLRGVLCDAFATHDPYMHSFDVTLSKRHAAEATPTVQVDPFERAWYAQDHIRSLCVTIVASDEEDVNRASEMVRFLLWVLEWAQRYSSTLEEVRITVPDSFPLPSDESGSDSYSFLPPNVTGSVDSVEVLANLTTLTWTGDTRVLRTFLARFAPFSLHVLRIESAALSVDDALQIISQIANCEIYALELGTLNTSAPSLVGADLDLRLPLYLPYLDSLKVASSIPLERFFSVLSLPCSLCKIEFDLTSAGSRVEEVIQSLITSDGLLEKFILFMDIEVESAFEGMEEAMRRIKEKAPFAYVAFRGQVAEGAEVNDSV